MSVASDKCSPEKTVVALLLVTELIPNGHKFGLTDIDVDQQADKQAALKAMCLKAFLP